MLAKNTNNEVNDINNMDGCILTNLTKQKEETTREWVDKSFKKDSRHQIRLQNQLPVPLVVVIAMRNPANGEIAWKSSRQKNWRVKLRQGIQYEVPRDRNFYSIKSFS